MHPGLTCSRVLSGEVSLTPTVRTPSPEVESTIGRAASHDIEPGDLAPSSEVEFHAPSSEVEFSHRAPSSEVELPAPRARVTRVPQREDRTVVSEDDDVTRTSNDKDNTEDEAGWTRVTGKKRRVCSLDDSRSRGLRRSPLRKALRTVPPQKPASINTEQRDTVKATEKQLGATDHEVICKRMEGIANHAQGPQERSSSRGEGPLAALRQGQGNRPPQLGRRRSGFRGAGRRRTARCTRVLQDQAWRRADARR